MRPAVLLCCLVLGALFAAPAHARTIQGVASWYGATEEGRLTANGQRFHARGMTAASRSLPFGTKIRVTNQRNGRAVTVVVNDRGPYIAGRTLDLTRAAMARIGGVHAGVVPVVIEILSPEGETPL